MADERSRSEIAQTLSEHLGSPVAAALMEAIPPFGWHEIATKSDLRALERRFDEVDRRFDEVDRRFAELDRRFDHVDARFDLVDERFAVIDHKLDVLRVEIRGDLDRQTVRLVRWLVTTVLGSIAAVGGAVAGVAALVS